MASKTLRLLGMDTPSRSYSLMMAMMTDFYTQVEEGQACCVYGNARQSPESLA